MDLIGTQVDSLARALLVNHPGVPSDFDRVLATAAQPVRVSGSRADGDGVLEAGVEMGGTFNRLFLMPYCDGPPGSQFMMRVYGVRRTATGPAERTVWEPYPLAEFLCTAGALPGPQTTATGQPIPPGTPSPFWHRPSENVCDDLTLTRGGLGQGGFVTSFGAGSGLASTAYLDVGGTTLVLFDFAPVSDVTMNCFYARC